MKNKIKSFIYKISGVSFLYFFALTVSANGTSPNAGPLLISNPLGETKTIAGFITKLLDTIFPIASMLSIFFLIYAGFLMVMAGGNEEKLGSARRTLLWTMIGIAILLGAKVLSAVICGTISQLGSTAISCSI